MAAALVGGQVAGGVINQIEATAKQFEENPFGFMARGLRIVGGILFMGGGIAYVAGYYMVKSANNARADAVTTMNGMASAFTAGTSSSSGGGWGWNPIQDLTTIATDVVNGVKNSVAVVTDLPHAVFNSIMGFPRVLGDELWYLVGGWLGQLFKDIGPILAVLGGFLLGLSYYIGDDGAKAVARFRAVIARMTSRADAELRPELKVASDALRTTADAQAVAAGIPISDPEPTPPAPPSPAPEPEVSEPAPTPPDAPASIPEVGQPSDEQPPASEPAVPTPTSEVEAELGERPNRAPTMEEIRAMMEESERNRIESMPPPPKPKVRGRDWAKMASEAFESASA